MHRVYQNFPPKQQNVMVFVSLNPPVVEDNLQHLFDLIDQEQYVNRRYYYHQLLLLFYYILLYLVQYLGLNYDKRRRLIHVLV